MSDGISAAWDDALHYEQLCKEFNEEIRYKGPGPWPYNMDSDHYERLISRSKEDPAIRLVRPLQMEYITVGKILLIWGDYVYKSTEHEFVNKCMMLSGGSINPVRLRTIYNQLMNEAGL